jgi:NhaP-type Na+/H+ or K+/H+ antiporter
MSRECIICGRTLRTGRLYCYTCRGFRNEREGNIKPDLLWFMLIILMTPLIGIFICLTVCFNAGFVGIILAIVAAILSLILGILSYSNWKEQHKEKENLI